MGGGKLRSILFTLLAGLAVPPALATWSVLLVDSVTKEIMIGSCTCIEGSNLKKLTPVLLVDVGAATAQSYVDGTGTNRLIIWNELLNGTSPDEILDILEQADSGHQTRQYGIVDTLGRAATFSGTEDGPWAGGVIGRFGSISYAIQGNVLTGEPVVTMAEQAVLNTPGGLPEKLMAAMEAARAMGGDGRCSCAPNDPTGCGAPPDDFTKSAHIGYVIGSRRGDIDGNCDTSQGCASGTYYLFINIRGQHDNDPDPVFQLQEAFDAWRAGLVGVPDQVESQVTIAPCSIPNDGVSTATMTIELLDWQGSPATDILDVAVLQDPLGSAGASAIGPVSDLGGGRYEVTLTAGATPGTDNLAVQVTSASQGARYLVPSRQLIVQDQAHDLTGDGRIDLADLSVLLATFGKASGATQAEGDLNGDGAVDLADLSLLLNEFNGGC